MGLSFFLFPRDDIGRDKADWFRPYNGNSRSGSPYFEKATVSAIGFRLAFSRFLQSSSDCRYYMWHSTFILVPFIPIHNYRSKPISISLRFYLAMSLFDFLGSCNYFFVFFCYVKLYNHSRKKNSVSLICIKFRKIWIYFLHIFLTSDYFSH